MRWGQPNCKLLKTHGIAHWQRPPWNQEMKPTMQRTEANEQRARTYGGKGHGAFLRTLRDVTCCPRQDPGSKGLPGNQVFTAGWVVAEKGLRAASAVLGQPEASHGPSPQRGLPRVLPEQRRSSHFTSHRSSLISKLRKENLPGSDALLVKPEMARRTLHPRKSVDVCQLIALFSWPISQAKGHR